MKSILSIFAITLFSGLLSAQTTYQNLLNKDYFSFEAGGEGWWIQHPDYWQIENNKAATGQYSIHFNSTTEPGSTVKANGGNSSFPGSLLSLEPGDYEMKVKVWVDENTTVNKFLFIIKDSWTRITWQLDTVTRGTWVTLSQPLSISQTVLASGVLLTVDSGMGSFYIDDIEIWGEVEAPAPLIPKVATIQTTNSQIFDLEPGTYEVKVKVWKEPGCTIKQFVSYLSDPWVTIEWELENVPEAQWTELSQEIQLIDSLNDSSIYFSVANSLENGSGTFYIDEMQFVRQITAAPTWYSPTNETRIFPNPASNSFTIDSKQTGRILFFNVSGVKIMEMSIESSPITVPVNWKPGLYLYKLIGKHQISEGKLIIQ